MAPAGKTACHFSAMIGAEATSLRRANCISASMLSIGYNRNPEPPTIDADADIGRYEYVPLGVAMSEPEYSGVTMRRSATFIRWTVLSQIHSRVASPGWCQHRPLACRI